MCAYPCTGEYTKCEMSVIEYKLSWDRFRTIYHSDKLIEGWRIQSVGKQTELLTLFEEDPLEITYITRIGQFMRDNILCVLYFRDVCDISRLSCYCPYYTHRI